ncbi:MAG: S41 family peptidase [Pseudomonadota bacterium]
MFRFIRSAAILGASVVAMTACALKTPPANADMLSPDQARADLERLYSGLQAAEANLFAVTSPEVFERRYNELHSRFAEPVSEFELFRALQQFAALAKHGHTRLEGLNPAWSTHVEADGTVFPLDLIVDEGEVIVVGAPESSGMKPGDRILSIDGAPNPIWLPKVTRNISAETPELAYALMANGTPYYMWLEYGSKATFSVEIDRAGQAQTVEAAAITLDELYNVARLEDDFTLAGRDAKMLGDDVAYLRPGGFFNLDAETQEDAYAPEALAAYQAFLDEAFTTFIDEGASHLVLDLRDNPGGTNSFSDPVVAWFADEPFRFASDFRIRVSDETTASNAARLENVSEEDASISRQFADLFAEAEIGDVVSFDIPYAEPRDGKRFVGEVHVLVNRYSYSNAVSVAAIIQDYEFGTIYGEPTRDMATTYGAMEHFTLPNTGFLVGYPKAHIIRPNGEKHSHPVHPNIELPTKAIRGEQDIMLNALLELLAQD